MSTTYVDPTTHNFVKKASVVWHITLGSDHNGRVLGDANHQQREHEITFPPGTEVHILKIVYRQKNKNYLKEIFGNNAEFIIFAEINNQK